MFAARFRAPVERETPRPVRRSRDAATRLVATVRDSERVRRRSA